MYIIFIGLQNMQRKAPQMYPLAGSARGFLCEVELESWRSRINSREMFHKANRGTAAEKTLRKIEAGAVAFVVAQAIGLSQDRHTPSWLESFRTRSARTEWSALCPTVKREGFPMSEMALFEERPVRRVFHNEEWWFVLTDIVSALTDSPAPSDYLKKLRRRDPSLAEAFKGGGQFVPPLALPFETEGGMQKLQCWNVPGILRLIQSIPSPKAEPFKRWLAKVGYERLQEIADPALALERTRENWRKLGRSEKWITQRMTGQETRNKLTDYWASHEVKQGQEFAILTNIIHEEWSGVSVKEHKDLKGLENQNLRDHMSEAELIFTALAELSTRQIAETEAAVGLPANKKAAKTGGGIAHRARLELESKTGRKVVTGENYLPPSKTKKNLKP
jgi:prophage antirepressor-like protein